MPTPMKPMALKELNGSAKHNSNRINKDQPEVTRGIGPPPSYLLKGEKDIWNETVQIIYAGVFAEGDRHALEVYSKLLYRFRYAGRKKNILWLSAAELSQLTKLMSLFGMTPSDRQKIIVPKSKETGNKFNNFKKK